MSRIARGAEMSSARTLLQIRSDCTHRITIDQLNISEFGKCLRRLREDSGISLREMAKRLGVSAPYLSDAELGVRKLTLRRQLDFVSACEEGKAK